MLTPPGDGNGVFARTARVVFIGEHAVLTGNLLYWLLNALCTHTHTIKLSFSSVLS